MKRGGQYNGKGPDNDTTLTVTQAMYNADLVLICLLALCDCLLAVSSTWIDVGEARPLQVYIHSNIRTHRLAQLGNTAG